MFRTLALFALPVAIAAGPALQASAKEEETCVYVNDNYRNAAVTCGCPVIKESVITIPSMLCTSNGRWEVKPDGCGSVTLNSNAEAMYFFVKLRKASKC